MATDIPVVSEIVQHGVNGWLTRYNDAADLARGVLQLLDNADLRQRLVAGGQATIATRYREDTLVGELENVFCTAIQRRAGKVSVGRS